MLAMSNSWQPAKYVTSRHLCHHLAGLVNIHPGDMLGAGLNTYDDAST